MPRPSHAARRALLAALAAAAAGCSVLPQPAAPGAEYDFGPAPAAAATPRVPGTVLVPEVSAPGWLENGALVYRLAYRDGASPRAYANSRWVTSPPALYTARLRGSVAASSSGGAVAPGDNARYDAALRVEIVEFSQVFDAPEASRAVVQVRGTLVRDQRVAAQRTFTAERRAATADAAGGAAALAGAADDSIAALVRWTAEVLAPR
jgi:cholesterol transport system auxiliary component